MPTIITNGNNKPWSSVDPISRFDTLYYLKHPVFNKNLEYMQINKKFWPIERKKSTL